MKKFKRILSPLAFTTVLMISSSAIASQISLKDTNHNLDQKESKKSKDDKDSSPYQLLVVQVTYSPKHQVTRKVYVGEKAKQLKSKAKRKVRFAEKVSIVQPEDEKKETVVSPSIKKSIIDYLKGFLNPSITVPIIVTRNKMQTVVDLGVFLLVDLIKKPNTQRAILAHLIRQQPDLNQQDSNGNTLLHLCVMIGYVDGVVALLENKSIENKVNKQGQTALVAASHCIQRDEKYELIYGLLTNKWPLSRTLCELRTQEDYDSDSELEEYMEKDNSFCVIS